MRSFSFKLLPPVGLEHQIGFDERIFSEFANRGALLLRYAHSTPDRQCSWLLRQSGDKPGMLELDYVGIAMVDKGILKACLVDLPHDPRSLTVDERGAFGHSIRLAYLDSGWHIYNQWAKSYLESQYRPIIHGIDNMDIDARKAFSMLFDWLNMVGFKQDRLLTPARLAGQEKELVHNEHINCGIGRT